jgi:phosphoserine phosphatase
MPFLTLIAAPGRLTAGRVEALITDLGGLAPVWLAQGEAARFVTPAPVPDGVWESLQAEGIDLCAQDVPPAPAKLLLADMDSTMIGQECVDELAGMAGVGPRVADITARAMNGELDFEEALTERVGLLKGLPVDVIDRVMAERITYAAGGATLIATMKAHGALTALVSGGFTAFTARVAAHLGFDRDRANMLLEDGGTLTGEVAHPILGAQAKVQALEELCAELGIGAHEAAAVGDGANDLPMIRAAGLGVALHAKPTVQAQAALRVNHGDLTALLYLQGIPKADFVMP